MKHLTTDEILDFVTLESLDGKGLALSKKVNEHIRSCPSCRQKVTAFLEVSDELTKLKGLSFCKANPYRLASTWEDEVDFEVEKLLKDVGEKGREGAKLEL